MKCVLYFYIIIIIIIIIFIFFFYDLSSDRKFAVTTVRECALVNYFHDIIKIIHSFNYLKPSYVFSFGMRAVNHLYSILSNCTNLELSVSVG